MVKGIRRKPLEHWQDTLEEKTKLAQYAPPFHPKHLTLYGTYGDRDTWRKTYLDQVSETNGMVSQPMFAKNHERSTGAGFSLHKSRLHWIWLFLCNR